ncbi:hypothetical protein RRG08_004647 [Elysia crispata]|uniref:Uncharacterized protein n=1 Tax=Elysia crispata TaxID=231223 RepID=A0AAE1DF01_9GAST|nr:hypothetical protein RRG08_004647 [Elysia crispata]
MALGSCIKNLQDFYTNRNIHPVIIGHFLRLWKNSIPDRNLLGLQKSAPTALSVVVISTIFVNFYLESSPPTIENVTAEIIAHLWSQGLLSCDTCPSHRQLSDTRSGAGCRRC